MILFKQFHNTHKAFFHHSARPYRNIVQEISQNMCFRAPRFLPWISNAHMHHTLRRLLPFACAPWQTPFITYSYQYYYSTHHVNASYPGPRLYSELRVFITCCTSIFRWEKRDSPRPERFQILNGQNHGPLYGLRHGAGTAARLLHRPQLGELYLRPQ